MITEFGLKDTTHLTPSARLCEELELHAAAERLYRLADEKADARRPVQALALASYLGRRGRGAEAMDVLDRRAWGTLPAADVSSTALAILFGAGIGDSALHQRLARHLEAAVRQYPTVLALRFDLANLLCLQGRYDEGEKIFRELADKNPSLSAPLNNLAWIQVMRGEKADGPLKLIARAVELDGEKPELLDTRAVARLAANQPDLAARDLEDAIAVSPTPDKYFHLARVYRSGRRRPRRLNERLREAQSRGLNPAMLHPLEQASYKLLVAEFPTR